MKSASGILTGNSLGIDLMDFPAPHSEAMDLDRHLMMQRARIRLFPISRLDWDTKREQVQQELENWRTEPSKW